jgi:hypothetical protein
MDPNDVIKGVYAKWFAESGIILAQRLFYKKVPQGTALPYADVDIATAVYDQNFNEEADEFTILLRIFDDDRSDAGDLCDTLTTIFDNCSLTVTGWRHLSMEREFVEPIDDLENMQAPVYGWAIQYSVMVEKNK